MRNPLMLTAIALAAPGAFAADPCPIQRLEAQPGLGGVFGVAMQIESGRLLVSDWGALTACPGGGDPFSCTAGAIYSFRLEGSQWVDRQLIYPWDIGFNEGFGTFDVEGDRMIATTAKRNQDSRQGLAHIYHYDHAIGEWFEFDRFQAPDAPERPRGGFGPVALRGDSVLIGRDETVFLYQKLAEDWELSQTIERPASLPYGSDFGKLIVMNDDWAVIAALRDRTLGYDHGALYVYRRNADGLLHFHEKALPPYDPGGFGSSMSLDGSTFAIWGGGSDPTGSIFVYELTADGLEFRQDVTVVSGRSGMGLGIGIAVRGDTMVCGSFRGWTETRLGYVFRRGADGQWRQVAELDPGPAVPGTPHTSIGHATATDGRFAIIGSPYEWPDAKVEGTGAAYSFDLDCEICEPDLDLDGSLTIFDFLAFFNLFDDGDPIADFDGDGELTIFDFLAFQTAFDAGCA